MENGNHPRVLEIVQRKIEYDKGTFFLLRNSRGREGSGLCDRTFTVKGICRVLRYERGEGDQKCQFSRYVTKERSLNSFFLQTREPKLTTVLLASIYEWDPQYNDLIKSIKRCLKNW